MDHDPLALGHALDAPIAHCALDAQPAHKSVPV